LQLKENSQLFYRKKERRTVKVQRPNNDTLKGVNN